MPPSYTHAASFLPCPPQPAASPLVHSEALVETFEEGELISKYVGTTGQYNKKLADLGLHCYLKRLLRDNFIHADLHPGNILVRLEEPGGVLAGLRRLLGGGWEFKLPKLVLLDVGMIAKLSSEDQENMVGFFQVRCGEVVVRLRWESDVCVSPCACEERGSDALFWCAISSTFPCCCSTKAHAVADRLPVAAAGPDLDERRCAGGLHHVVHCGAAARRGGVP